MYLFVNLRDMTVLSDFNVHDLHEVAELCVNPCESSKDNDFLTVLMIIQRVNYVRL